MVAVLNNNKARDPFLLACARNIWAISAQHNIHIRVVHIPGKNNIYADALSRWYDVNYNNVMVKNWLKVFCQWWNIDECHFDLDWDI